MLNSKYIKLIILAVLFIHSKGSFAEWIDVERFESGNLYLESKSIHRFDDVVEAVILQNLKESEQGSKSILSDVSYDCKKKLMSVMTIQRYPHHYAKGKILSFDTYTDGAWKINKPVSANSKLFLQVCGKYTKLPNNK